MRGTGIVSLGHAAGAAVAVPHVIRYACLPRDLAPAPGVGPAFEGQPGLAIDDNRANSPLGDTPPSIEGGVRFLCCRVDAHRGPIGQPRINIIFPPRDTTIAQSNWRRE
jgi:hypothetical protein